MMITIIHECDSGTIFEPSMDVIGLGGGTIFADSVDAHESLCSLLSVSADGRLWHSSSTRIGSDLFVSKNH